MKCYDNNCNKEACAMIVVSHTRSVGAPKLCKYFCRKHFEDEVGT